MVDRSAAPGRQPRDRLPRNRQRERVLQLVRECGGAIDAAELSSRMGLHITTVRFHLQSLCDDGSVTRTSLKRTGAGRPRTGYVAVQGKLDYHVLAEVLATALGGTEEIRGRRAEHAGRNWAARMPESDGGLGGDTIEDGLQRAASVAQEVFERMGFAPEAVPAPASEARERSIRLHDCPVRELARSHPEVGCRLHLGVLQGLVGRQGPTMSAELAPFVEPELCIAKVAAR